MWVCSHGALGDEGRDGTLGRTKVCQLLGRLNGLSGMPPVSGWAGVGATSVHSIPTALTLTHFACSQHGAASRTTKAKTCRTQHTSTAQGEPTPGCPWWSGLPTPVSILEAGTHPTTLCCIAGGDALGGPRHPVTAGRAGGRHRANPALQQDVGCSPHTTGHGHCQRGGRRGGTTRLEPAARCVLGTATAGLGHGSMSILGTVA